MPIHTLLAIREMTQMEACYWVTDMERLGGSIWREHRGSLHACHLARSTKMCCGLLIWKCYSLSHVWLCDPMRCNPPGFSVHWILWARILEWIAIPFSRGSSWPQDWIQVSHIAGRFFTVSATREASKEQIIKQKYLIGIDVSLVIPIPLMSSCWNVLATFLKLRLFDYSK